jgi:hypothetical protein
MSPEDVREINRARLEEWGQVLNEEHATAAVLVAVGHDEATGDVRVCAPAGVANKTVERLLRLAAGLVESQDPVVIPPKQ